MLIKNQTPPILRRNIHYIRQLNVKWATISQVEYQIRLLEAALENHFDYVFMLSAFDYPIWSNTRIEEYLKENQEAEFLQAIKVQSTYYLKDLQREIRPDINITWMPNIFNRAVRFTLYNMLKCLRVRKSKQLSMPNGERWDVYKGSDYFCISFDLAKYIVEQYRKHPCIRSYFKHTFAPSETLIHTIAFNSRYSSKCINVKGPYQGLQSLTPLHYIDGCIIKVLDETDYVRILNSEKMFARKFRTGISEKLISMIDSNKEAE